MADINTISEDLVINILSRLPVKPLLRSKCVSKYWCRLIANADFMKLRSRHMILLPLSPLYSVDHNVPADDAANSIVEVSHELPNDVTILGTIDGVVVLVVERSFTSDIILYNPFTRDRKSIPIPDLDPDPLFALLHNFCSAYGFGYGLSPKDLKVVEFRRLFECRVFSFEDGSWRASQVSGEYCVFRQKVGIFTNGFLHWMGSTSRYDMFIAALDITKMVFTRMQTPAPCGTQETLLDRTSEGWLSMVCYDEHCKVDVWVMKEYGLEGSWSKLFTVPLINIGDDWVSPIAVLGNLKIVMMKPYKEIYIYDPEKKTSKKVTAGMNIAKPWIKHGIEYVESLVSTSALCPKIKKSKKKF